MIEPCGQVSEAAGYEPDTTNNRMEMMAVIDLLEHLPKDSSVLVHSDSNLLVKGWNEWLPGWKRRDWTASTGKPVANRDLWERLVRAAARIDRFRLVWVKGHADNAGNNRADELCSNAIAAQAGFRSTVGAESSRDEGNDPVSGPK